MNDVRALLLTDVVDSTKLSEKIGDHAMAEVWAAHDRVARDLLPRWQGREIDKTDGMLLLFNTAADAVSYALAYHHALAAMATPLKARAGLHVGPVILRENSAADVALGAKPLEVDGLAKPTAARVMSLAVGGQTLLTSEAREDLGKTALKIESHGHWIVKGVAEPIELFEAGDQDTRFVAPPDSDKVFRVVRAGDWWLPVKDIPSNLPFQATSFIGREKELGEVKAYLAKNRLVTLLGMGGLGKTRLSLQVAAELLHQYPDGAWFLDLAPLRDAALVVGEAAQVMGISEEPDRPLLQTLCAYLKPKRSLLILDNCEHLIKACADLASAILRAAPHVRVLASSREALRVSGEQSYPVLPLPVPGRGDGIKLLSASTAVRLFVERAQQHKPTFALNDREAPGIAELVARLEGIPLALELAAARVRSLSVAEINARLKDRYKILTGGSRALQERQQTLRALVDWSYELLNDPEQTVLRRLGTFVGGFDLSAAENVCGAEPLDTDDVIDILGSLVEKSLVMLDEREDGTRYRILETIREYARERLELAGETAATAARHCEHFFVLAKEARRGIQGPDQAEWVRRMETELDNVRSATSLALAGGVDPFIAVKLAVAMMGFWLLRGYATEGRNVVRASLALPAIQVSDLAQTHALYVGACLAAGQSDNAEAQQMLETCLELRRGLANPVDIAATLSTLSLVRLQAGDTVGARVGEREALQIFRQLGDRAGEAIGLLHLGQIEAYDGEYQQARGDLLGCLSIAREMKDQEVEGECELVLGEVAFEEGKLDEARLRFSRSSTVCAVAADKRGEANAQWWLAKTDIEAGSFDAARLTLHEVLQSFREFKMQAELLSCLEDHAALALHDQAPQVAVRLIAAAALSRERLHLPRSPRSQARWETLMEALHQGLGASAFDATWEAARPWEIEDAVRTALSADHEPAGA